MPRRSDIQVRGCCCGIPFGCGTVVLVAAGYGLWRGVLAPAFAALLGL